MIFVSLLRKNHIILPALILVLGFAACSYLYMAESGKKSLMLREKARGELSNVEKSIDFQTAVLQSLVGFYNGSDKVSADEFQTFVDALALEDYGVLALQWLPRAAANDGDAYTVAYTAPAGSGLEYQNGENLWADAQNREAMERARDSGRAMATELLPGTGDGDGGMIRIFMPVYQIGPETDSVEKRRDNIEGFVAAVMRVANLFEASYRQFGASDIAREHAIFVYDEKVPPGSENRLVFSHAVGSQKSLLDLDEAAIRENAFWTGQLTFADRTWSVVHTDAQDTSSNLPDAGKLQAIIIGVLFTVLAAFFAFYTLRRDYKRYHSDDADGSGEDAGAENGENGRGALHSGFIDELHDGVIVIDLQKQGKPIVYVNEAFTRITGHPPDSLLGKGFVDLKFNSDEDEGRKLKTAYEENRPAQALMRMRHAEGSSFWNDVTVFQLRDDRDAVSTCVVTMRDVTPYHTLKDNLNKSREQIGALLDGVDDGLVMFSELGVIELFNDKAGEILGYKAQDMIGNGIDLIFPDIDWELEDDDDADASEGNYVRGTEGTTRGVTKTHDEISVDYSLREVRLGNEMVYIVTFEQDMAAPMAEKAAESS